MISQLRAYMTRLATRLTLAFLLVAFIPLILVGGYGLRVNTESLQEQAIQAELLHLEDVARSIETFFRTTASDIQFLAQSAPVQTFLVALREADSTTVSRARESVAQEFIALAEARGTYYKIQLLDSDGTAVMSVVADNRGFIVHDLPVETDRPSELVVQGDNLAEGEIYVSRLRLASEEGTLVTPYLPTVQYVTPVFVQGERVGFVVTSVDARSLFEHLEKMEISPSPGEHDAGQLFLIDEQGFYLWHPNPQKRWGAPWDLNTGEQFGRDFPDMVEVLQAETPGAFQADRRLISYMPLSPNANYRWTLVEVAPLQKVLAPVGSFRTWFGILMLLALMASVGLGALIAHSIARPVSALNHLATRIEQGDLRPTEEVRASGEVGALARAFHHMQHELRTLIQRIIQSTQETHTAAETLSSMTAQLRLSAEQIATAVQQIAQGASVQASQIDNISRAIQHLAQATDRIATNAEQTREASHQAADKAAHLVETLDALQRRSEDIQSMAQTVKRFADQTNLLALNAAIEAARAGEHGKSFAVVADEVRRLAESSRQAVEDITTINAQVQATVQDVTAAVLDIANIVHETADLARQTAEATAQQRRESETVVEGVNEIAALAEEQAASTEEMATAVEEQMVSTEELASAAERLSRLASDLETLVAKFRVM